MWAIKKIRKFFSIISHLIFFTKPNDKILLPRMVTAVFTWMALITFTAMLYAQAGFTEAPFWLDIIASTFGITASIRIAEGVILSPDQISNISKESDPIKAIGLIVELLKDASHYCLQGVLIIIYAFILQLTKVYITEHQDELKHNQQQKEVQAQQASICNPLH